MCRSVRGEETANRGFSLCPLTRQVSAVISQQTELAGLGKRGDRRRGKKKSDGGCVEGGTLEKQ